MSVFVDTSAFLALLDADEVHHEAIRVSFEKLLHNGEPLVTSNYVLVETAALLQHRFGIPAFRLFTDDVAPVVGTLWVDAEMHAAAVSAVLAAARKRLSLVDCASFEAMRRSGVKTALTLDRHFAEQGFGVVP